jgi:uncharacterized membrane protein
MADSSINVLLAGESWTSHTIHVKGFDSFTTSDYAEGAGWLIEGLRADNIKVDFLQNHRAAREFPTTLEELTTYDVVLLSDIGSNTLLLHPDTFAKSKPLPNRCNLLADYVRDGGGLAMIGGYMSFSGIDGKARYQFTALREVLPIEMLSGDDRVETPQGVVPEIRTKDHPVFSGVSGVWPQFLGYNQLRPRQGYNVLATVGADVFIAVGEFGRGRSAVFASDCGPHWGPLAFVEWEHYGRFWSNLIRWLTQQDKKEG